MGTGRSLNNCGGAACQFSAAAAEMIFALVFYVSGLLQHDVVVNSWPTCVYQPKICTKNSFLQSEAATFIHTQIALAYSSHDKVIKLIKSHLSNQFWKASSQFHSFLLSFCSHHSTPLCQDQDYSQHHTWKNLLKKRQLNNLIKKNSAQNIVCWYFGSQLHSQQLKVSF